MEQEEAWVCGPVAWSPGEGSEGPGLILQDDQLPGDNENYVPSPETVPHTMGKALLPSLSYKTGWDVF